MEEVINFALTLSLHISQCEAAHILRISDSVKTLVAGKYKNETTPEQTINLILPNIKFTDGSLKISRPEKLDSEFPKVVYCEKICSNEQQEFYFMLISLSQLNIKPSIKKMTDALISVLGENCKNVLWDTVKENAADKNQHYLLSDDFIFSLNRDGKIVEVNPAGEFMLGYSLNELTGKHFNDLLPVFEFKKAAKFFNELMQSRSSKSVQLVMLSITGEEIKFNLRCNIVSKANEEIKIQGIAQKRIEDQTIVELNSLKQKLNETERILNIERSRVNQQKVILEELNRMKNDFISNISHEFRTPLASIIGFSETINTEPGISEEMKNEFNREILNEAKRLAKLINEVLDTTSVAGRQISLNKSLFDLCGLTAGVLEKHHKILSEKKIILNKNFCQNEAIVFADTKKISQVVYSLLDISISSCNAGGRIYISVSDFGEEAELQIIDSGQGFSKSELQRVFSNQYNLSKENFTSYLLDSLVFAKQIVDLHGGLFTIDSEINKGTSFVIKLPGTINRQHS